MVHLIKFVAAMLCMVIVFFTAAGFLQPCVGQAAVKKSSHRILPAATATPSYLNALKGRWARCRPATNEKGEALKKGEILSFQDLYSQKSALSFEWTVASASDKDCKKIVREHRIRFECEAMSLDLLSCRQVAADDRKKRGPWLPAQSLNADPLSMKLSIDKKDPSHLSLKILSDETEETETIDLTPKD